MGPFPGLSREPDPPIGEERDVWEDLVLEVVHSLPNETVTACPAARDEGDGDAGCLGHVDRLPQVRLDGACVLECLEEEWEDFQAREEFPRAK